MPCRGFAFLILSKEGIKALECEQGPHFLEGSRKELEVEGLNIIRDMSQAPTPVYGEVVDTIFMNNDNNIVPILEIVSLPPCLVMRVQ